MDIDERVAMDDAVVAFMTDGGVGQRQLRAVLLDSPGRPVLVQIAAPIMQLSAVLVHRTSRL